MRWLRSYVTCHKKYCTIDLICVQRKTYSLERMKTAWRQSWWKKITIMQQRSTEQRSTIDSRRRLTNFKMLVSHLMSAVLRQSVNIFSNVKLSDQSVLRNMPTVCWGCCQNQQHFLIFNFHSVATYRTWGGSLCALHREFSRESAGESILILGPHLPKLLSNIKWLPFLGHSVDRYWQVIRHRIKVLARGHLGGIARHDLLQHKFNFYPVLFDK